jgi:hypothetical protein
VGASQQVTILLDRDPAGNADLTNPTAVASLLDYLREVGAGQQVRTLADRLPAAGLFEPSHEYFWPRFRFGCEQDSRPAEFWDWDDLD